MEGVAKPNVKINKVMNMFNLTINTTYIKKYIKDKLDSENLVIEKRETFITKKWKIGISTSYVPIIVFVEKLIDYIVKNTIEDSENDFNGLIELKYLKLENLFYKNRVLRNSFINLLFNYDRNENYKIKNPINFKIINHYINTKISKSIKLDNDYMNFLCFVVNKSINQIINTAINILTFVKKVNLKPEIIKFVISILYKDFYDLIEINLNDCLEYKKEDKTKENNSEESEEETKEDKSLIDIVDDDIKEITYDIED